MLDICQKWHCETKNQPFWSKFKKVVQIFFAISGVIGPSRVVNFIFYFIYNMYGTTHAGVGHFCERFISELKLVRNKKKLFVTKINEERSGH